MRAAELPCSLALLSHAVARAGSKRCDAFRPHLLELATSGPWAERLAHAQSDITDQRGYTSYFEKHGATKLPTLVLFRKGQPHKYPYEATLDKASIVDW